MIVRDTFMLCASKRLNGQPFYVAQILKDCNATRLQDQYGVIIDLSGLSGSAAYGYRCDEVVNWWSISGLTSNLD